MQQKNTIPRFGKQFTSIAKHGLDFSWLSSSTAADPSGYILKRAVPFSSKTFSIFSTSSSWVKIWSFNSETFSLKFLFSIVSSGLGLPFSVNRNRISENVVWFLLIAGVWVKWRINWTGIEGFVIIFCLMRRHLWNSVTLHARFIIERWKRMELCTHFLLLFPALKVNGLGFMVGFGENQDWKNWERRKERNRETSENVYMFGLHLNGPHV